MGREEALKGPGPPEALKNDSSTAGGLAVVGGSQELLVGRTCLRPASDLGHGGPTWRSDALQVLERKLAELEERYTSKQPASTSNNTPQPAASAAAEPSFSELLGSAPHAHVDPHAPLQSLVNASQPLPAAGLAPDLGYVPAMMKLYDPSRPHMHLSAEAAARARLTEPLRAMMTAPGPPASTWEANRSKALLALEDQMKELEQRAARRAGKEQGQGQEAGQQQPFQQGARDPADKENSSAAGPSGGVSSAVGTVPTKYYPPAGLATGAGSGAVPSAEGGLLGAAAAAQAAAAASAPSWRRALETPGAAAPSLSSLSSFTPGGPSAGAAAAAGAPGMGGTWERNKSQALLLLERQRDALASQLEQYAQLDAVHRRQLQEVHARHAKALENAQVCAYIPGCT